MITKEQLIEKLQYFVEVQLERVAKTNPVVSLIKPIASRILNKKLTSITDFLDLLSDDKGNIDIESIIDEMTSSVINTQSFKVNVPILGVITIGDGKIEFGIPFTDKSILFNENDLSELKSMLTSI